MVRIEDLQVASILVLFVAACSPERSQQPAVATTSAAVSPEPVAQRALAEPSKGSIEAPALRGRVNDYADVLTPDQEAELSGLYESVEREIGAQIALLTVKSLNGVPIADYSLAVANTWALGRRGVDDGLLLTIALNERATRIEVGYGLELVVVRLGLRARWQLVM